MILLQTSDLTKHFGGLVALSSIDFAVNSGEILGLIGPNGAGKTTLFNVINGVYSPDSGNIWFKGERIRGLKPHQIAKRGLIRTFQATTLFGEGTVEYNLSVGLHLLRNLRIDHILLRNRAYKYKMSTSQQRLEEVLKFTGLAQFRNRFAKSLPYGLQRVLGVGIALCANPELLMLDEPMAGMNPMESENMTNLVRRVKEELRCSVVIVDHNMRAIMNLCEKIVVLVYGRKVAEGAPAEIVRNSSVIEAYLGRRKGGA